MKSILSIVALALTAMLISGFSSDLSTRFNTLENPSVAGSRLPRLKTLPSGDVLMSWVEPRLDGHALKFGVWQDGRWVRQGEVAHGDNWFVNWSDFPSVVAIDERFWVSHRLVRITGGKAHDYDVTTSISNDAGVTWSEPSHPHRDGTVAEHGFAAIFPVDGDAGIVWLDGRYHLKKEERVKYPEKSGNFNLRYTRIHRDGSMEAEQVIDSNTCTCCWPSVAVTSAGPVVAWRGRTDEEIRDNRISLLRDGEWSSPDALGAEGWKIEGCPVNGPAVSARGMQVVAAWFTAESDRPRVRAAFSTDGGKSFSKPIEIDEASPLGRIGLVWRDDNTALVSWMTATDHVTKKSNLALRAIHTDGTSGPIKSILEISAGRETGVPQIVANEKGLMLAWTDIAPNYGVRTAFIRWDDLQYKPNFKSASLSKVAFLGHNTHPFAPTICGQRH